MMHNNMMPPPTVPGVTEGVPTPDPLRMMAMMMAPPSGTGIQLIAEAIAKLKQASKVDPRMQDPIAEALRILTQGGDTHDQQGCG